MIISREHRWANCRVRQYGDGARVFVGFHGWSGSAASFEPLTKHLPKNTSLYAFDLPGTGQSQKPRLWTAPAMVEMLEHAMDESGTHSVELIGVCGGVSFALPLATRRPDLISRLVMVDPFAFVPWFFRVFTIPWIGRGIYQLTFANPLGRWITNGALAHRRANNSNLTEGFSRVSHDLNWGQLLAMCDGANIQLSDFRAFSGQVDILYGTETFRSVLISVSLFKSVFSEARVTEVLGAGHMPMHEATQEVARIVYGEEI